MEGVDDPRPEIRIGDRERRDVDARLQRAHGNGVLTLTEYDERAALCWAARTRGDLDELTRDLPPDEPPTTVAPAPTTVAPVPVEHRQKGLLHRAGAALAGAAVLGVALVMGGDALTAGDATAVFGSQQVQLTGGQDRIEVGALFGSVTVRVPDHVRVRTTGRMIFGSVDCDAACQVGPATGPAQREVVVDASGAFGSVDVLRPNEQPRGDRDDDDEDDD